MSVSGVSAGVGVGWVAAGKGACCWAAVMAEPKVSSHLPLLPSQPYSGSRCRVTVERSAALIGNWS